MLFMVLLSRVIMLFCMMNKTNVLYIGLLINVL